MKKNITLLGLSLVLSLTINAQGVNKMFGLVGGYPQSDNSSNGFLFTTDSSGQNFQVQYNFPVAVSGANPANLELVPYNGKWYGTAYRGGTGNLGVLFEYDPATNIYTKKFDFGSNFNLYGANPAGSLLLYNNKFYGLTSGSGATGYGTLFEWDPATNIFTKKHDFAPATGNSPQNSLRLMNGKMYGTTLFGGPNGFGVVFEWNPANNTYTDLFDLTGPGAGNGYNFISNVTPYNNKIYCGSYQGAANGAGALYVIDPSLPNGSNATIIKVFDGSSGSSINNNEMIVYNNNLYGTLYQGGPLSYGTLFKVDPATNTFTKLVDFNYTTTGGNPLGRLVPNGSKFIGMCTQGGVNGKGTIYEWDPASPTVLTKKYDFGVSNNDNPISPGSTFSIINSKFYATTYGGGFNDQGTLFEYDYATGIVTKKLNFNAAENGRIPMGLPALLNGKIYGACYTAPQPDAGCIWEYDPSTNIYSRKFNFDMATGSGSGNRPNSSPVAFNGKLYGTTPSGGSGGWGVFYEFNPATNVYTKQDFQPIGGAYPIGEPTLYNNKFYGMTTASGVGNNGIIYSYDPATATLTKLFDVQNAGSNTPQGGFTVFNNKLYGTTSGSGANNFGGIIVFDPANNTASTVYSFASATGYNVSNLMTLYNNKLYGNAKSAGANGRGAIFQFDPTTNIYTDLYDYVVGVGKGYDPLGGLTLNGNKLYSITTEFSTIHVIEFDPATNTVTSKSSNTPASSYNLPLTHNGLGVFPAFIANGIANSCETYPTVVINGSNNNQWVPILSNDGDVVAEIKANGNILGNVDASTYINNGTVREYAYNHQLYLDRNITIKVQNPPSSNVDLRLYIKASEFLALKNAMNSQNQPSGISTINDIAVLKNSDDCPSSLSATPLRLSTTNENYEYGYVLKASVNSFSTFFFGKNNFSVLPVSLINFDAVKEDKRVNINWRVDNETAFSGYEVEKSLDNQNWQSIGSVTASNNTGVKTYSLPDEYPVAGTNYYRLKMLDKDGHFTYSKIVSINFSKPGLITLQPNPAKDFININNLVGYKQIQVFDLMGRMLIQKNIQNNSEQLNISRFSRGQYLIKLISEKEQRSFKFIKE